MFSVGIEKDQWHEMGQQTDCHLLYSFKIKTDSTRKNIIKYIIKVPRKYTS